MVLYLVSSLVLSLIPRALRVLRVLPAASHVTVEADQCRCIAECPTCGSASRRVQSNYRRKLRDLPSHGRVVTIHVSARRFRCLNPCCVRKTFAERLDDAMVSARRTKRLGDLQRHLGLALGGEAGTRLAERVAVPISADTLLRMAASTPANEVVTAVPRVLAVDDWAWRPHGSARTLVSRSSPAIVPALTPTASVRVHRTLFKSLIAGICCAISAMPFALSSIGAMSRFAGLPSRSLGR